MHEPTFLVMRTGDGYVAVSNSHGRYHGRTLVGFGAYIRSEMHSNFGIESNDVEFTQGEELSRDFPVCVTCGGTATIESERVDGQYFQSDRDTIDWLLNAPRTCPACAGLGCDMPEFWRSTVQTA
jgi:hypothetical protein